MNKKEIHNLNSKNLSNLSIFYLKDLPLASSIKPSFLKSFVEFLMRLSKQHYKAYPTQTT